MGVARTLNARVALVVASAALGLSAWGADSDLDGSQTPDDCNDGFGDARPGASEFCDGYDNDCDGLVDEGCLARCPAARAGEAIPHGDPAATPAAPALAGGGTGLAAIWRESGPAGPSLVFRHLDRWGGPRRDPIPFATGTVAGDAALAASGDWHGVVWLDDRDGNAEIWFARFRDVTAPPIERAVGTGNAERTDPAVAWTGERWAVAWVEGQRTLQVHVRAVTAEGFPAEERTASSKAGSARRPSLAADGSGLGVVWDDDRAGARGVFFRRLDAALLPLTGEIRVDDGSGTASAATIAWTGTTWLVAWVDGAGGDQVRVRALDPDGVPLAPSRTLFASPAATSRPSIAVTGEETLIAVARVDGAAHAIELSRIGPTGEVVESGTALATSPASSSPGLAWDGEGVRVAYVDDGGAVAVSAPRCCGDLDADGFDRCDDDCDDGDPGRWPDATDGCNGIDDDCDGDVDDVAAGSGCPAYCTDLDVLAPPVPHRDGTVTRMWDSAAAWDGQTFGVVWCEDADPSSVGGKVVFRRLDADGFPLADPVVLASRPTEDPGDPVIAATPEGWAVAWLRRDYPPGPTLARLSKDGALLAPPVEREATPTAGNPALVSDGRGFALAWGDGNSSRFARYSIEGTPIGAVESVQAGSPDLIWTGSEYLLVTMNSPFEEEGIYLDRFDGQGRRIQSRTALVLQTYGGAHDPDMAWFGTGFALVWIDNYESVDFRKFSPDGTPGPLPRTIAIGDFVVRPEIVWTGANFLVQYAHDSSERIEIVRVDSRGSLIGGTFVPSDGLTGSQWPFDRSGLAVGADGRVLSVFHRSYDPDAAVWSRLLGCCPEGDADGDGSCLADCDDTDPSTRPGAPEICDGRDNDCDGATVGEGPFETVAGFAFSDRSTMVWDGVGRSDARYDVERGDLAIVRASGGDFASATDTCVAADLAEPTATDGAAPAPAAAWFYLASAGSDRCNGTFASGGPGEAGDRDAGIAASAGACP